MFGMKSKSQRLEQKALRRQDKRAEEVAPEFGFRSVKDVAKMSNEDLVSIGMNIKAKYDEKEEYSQKMKRSDGRETISSVAANKVAEDYFILLICINEELRKRGLEEIK